MEALIQRQQELIKAVEQINSNFKKDSPERKTAEYIAKRIEKLKSLWSDFVFNHEQLLTYSDVTHDYFTKNMYKQLYDYYQGTLERIKSYNKDETRTTMDKEMNSKVVEYQKQQKTNYRAFQRAIQNIDIDELEGKWEIEEELRDIQRRWDAIDKLYWQIDDVMEGADTAYEEEYTTQKTAYKNIKKALNKKLTSMEHRKEATPKIEIPNFSGNYIYWPTFLDLFKETIHNNPIISKAQKMQHLKSKLKGEAERLIQHLHVSADNYDTAWEIIFQRYNNKQLLFTNQMELLLNQPNVHKQTAFEVKKLHDTSSECIHAIRNLGIDISSWDPFLVHVLTKKLDNDTYKDYQESRKNPRELASLQEFMSFLEAKFLALEPIRKKEEASIVKQNSAINIPFKRFTKTQNSNTYNYGEPRFQQTHQFNNNLNLAQLKTLHCPLCNLGHGIFQCKIYDEMTPEMRIKTITKLQLCKNCLFTHGKNYCTSTKRCKRCNAAHHTSLHEVYNARPSTSSAALNNINQPASHYQMNDADTNKYDEEVLLTTVQIRVKAGDNSFVTLRALLDQGSQVTMITENAVQRLGIPREHFSASICGVGAMPRKGRGKVTLHCQSLYDDFKFMTEALILPKLINNLPNSTIEKRSYEHLQNIQLADPEYHISKPIDIILDSKIYALIIMNGLLKGNMEQPIAQQTKLGWILSGSVTKTYNCYLILNNDDTMTKFWEIEEVTEMTTSMTKQEQYCEELYASTTRRLPDGKYEVRLPMKQNFALQLGSSRQKAVAQFKQLETKLAKNDELRDQYHQFIDEYIRLGHMKKCTMQMTQEPSCYLPHHDVHKEDSTTTKLRVVFNASAKTKSGYSLNDLMECGPKLQNDIQALLINWRSFKYVYTADCEKMYRMIWVHENDQQLQKIIWRNSKTGAQEEYQLCTVTYGMKAAPFLAMRTMKQLARDNSEKYPSAAKILENNFYVDDLLGGHNSLEESLTIQSQLLQIFNDAGINLRKWSSNNSELLRKLPKDRLNTTETSFKHSDSTKTLGLKWNPVTDSFKFDNKYNTTIDEQKCTKRMILSEISRTFDPLGWLSPVTIKAKLLFQRIWAANLDWDDVIKGNILQEWLQLRADMTNIDKIEIPRWMGDTQEDKEIHGFSDASEKAYACSVYLKTKDNTNNSIIRLIAAKTKVAPTKKPLTLPQLELCGAALLAKLINKIIASFPNKDIKIYAWTDSMVVLGWIHGDITRWKTFVANRVKAITDVVPAKNWRHVKSEENAADCASRGLLPSQLTTYSLWWEGPTWLKNDVPTDEKIYDDEKQPETKNKQVYTIQLMTSSIVTQLLRNKSSLTRVIRIIAWVLRFITNLRHNNNVLRNRYLSAQELSVALRLIIKTTQAEHFSDDIIQLKKGKELHAKSKILSLAPFLDDNGILRVGGRLQNSNLNYNTKHTILLPYDSQLTRLVIDDSHTRTLHGGASLTLVQLREKYWIISGIRAVKKQIRQCIKCRRHQARNMTQLMADLPLPRVTPSKPFTHTGVDFTGHVEIKANKGRGIKTTKGYIAVFVCFATKAIHLELVSDMTTAAFFGAFKRMCARRGMPTHMYSDNGKNFVGAAKILQKEYKQALEMIINEVLVDINNLGVTWHFNAPAWPSAGGLWEAAVKSVKYHLKRVIGEQKLTFEEFYTLLTQIEACLNSRPLYALTENVDDGYLTPGHFLTGGPLISTPLSIQETPISLGTRWQLVEKMHKSFWKKWSTEYLHHLQHRSKWRQAKSNLTINDVVLINDENLPPSKWALAKVIDVHPGTDGYVRVVTLKTRNGYVKRPVTKLTILPVDKPQSTNDVE